AGRSGTVDVDDLSARVGAGDRGRRRGHDRDHRGELQEPLGLNRMQSHFSVTPSCNKWVGTSTGSWSRAFFSVAIARSTESSSALLPLFSLNSVSAILPSGDRWRQPTGTPSSLRIVGYSQPSRRSLIRSM